MKTFKEFSEEQEQLDELFNAKHLKSIEQEIKNASASVKDKLFVMRHVRKLWDEKKEDTLDVQPFRSNRQLDRNEMTLAHAIQDYISSSTTLGFIDIEKVQKKILGFMKVK